MPPDKETARLIKALEENSRSQKKLLRVLEALNENLVAVGQLMKEDKEQ